jgi:putrescine oxidase
MRVDEAFSQGSIIKVQAIYPRPFWRDAGLSGVGFGPYETVREIYDNSPEDESSGVIVGFLAAEGADGAALLTPGERRTAVLGSFAAYLGQEALRPSGYVEHDWNAEEWTRGAYAATLGVGGVTRFGPDMRRPIGPFRFASTDISGVGHMHMEGAVRSAEAAVASVLAAC